MAYKKTVLKNGLRVISESVPAFRSVSVGLWVEIGSRHEAEQQAGISHFLEHMVFKGTRTRSARAIAVALESLGGTLNAFTAREQTCYYARMLGEHLPEAMDVLADILVNPKVSSADVDQERKVICEEIRDVEDAPSDFLHDLFCENLWLGHPIGRPIMGSVRTVNKITRKELVSHLRAHYTPENIIVAAAGNVDQDHLVRLVKKHCRFAGKNSAGELQQPPSNAPMRNCVQQRDLNQAHVCIGARAIPFLDKRRYALLVLNNLLGGGMSSRLFQTLREKRGLVYAIYSFHDFFKDTGIFGVYFGTDPHQTVQASDLVFEEFKKVKRRLVSSHLLHDVKNQTKGNFILGLESTSNRMHRLARQEMFSGAYIPVHRTMAAVDRVSARDILDFANEVFTPEGVSVAMIGAMGKRTLRNMDWGKLK